MLARYVEALGTSWDSLFADHLCAVQEACGPDSERSDDGRERNAEEPRRYREPGEQKRWKYGGLSISAETEPSAKFSLLLTVG